MAQHLGNLQAEDLESAFTYIWEDYIPYLHEALRIHKQLPKFYDQKDSIKGLTSQQLPSELRWLLYFIDTRHSDKEAICKQRIWNQHSLIFGRTTFPASTRPCAFINNFQKSTTKMTRLKGNLQAEDLESAFTDIWEDYIPCLHEALRIHKQLPKVYDQKDSIKGDFLLNLRFSLQ
ncbi:hypothetical protein M0R45_006816 [Rubus argutus]|uniref:Uncharacterized protein n=1 Tax=Rubus argutus TaxID=59490 RepID=A0AAW1YRU4_RUBAR